MSRLLNQSQKLQATYSMS